MSHTQALICKSPPSALFVGFSHLGPICRVCSSGFSEGMIEDGIEIYQLVNAIGATDLFVFYVIKANKITVHKIFKALRQMSAAFFSQCSTNLFPGHTSFTIGGK